MTIDGRVIVIKNQSVILNRLLSLRDRHWNREDFPLMWYIFTRHEVQVDRLTLFEDGWIIRIMEVLNQELSSGIRVYGFDADAIHRDEKKYRTEDFTVYGQEVRP